MPVVATDGIAYLDIMSASVFMFPGILKTRALKRSLNKRTAPLTLDVMLEIDFEKHETAKALSEHTRKGLLCNNKCREFAA